MSFLIRREQPPEAWQWLFRYHYKNTHTVVGLISGTSADGVDAALVRIFGPGPSAASVVHHLTFPYDKRVREAVLRCSQEGSVEEVCRLNTQLGILFARAAEKLIREAGARREEVDLIGSHGQTIRHLPPMRKRERQGGTPGGSSLQIADPAVIAYVTRIPVVSHFRQKDMAAGGQGAPLVPILDSLLFRHKERTRIVLNIGGIANVTVLPRSSETTFAFDTGPGNCLIDAAVSLLSGGRMTFDRNGRWAAKGKVCNDILTELLTHPFFSQSPPKSTGRETFGAHFFRSVMERAKDYALTSQDIVATLTAFTAESIVLSLERFVFPAAEGPYDLIVSGGGLHNPVLMRRLKDRLKGSEVLTSDAFGIPADAKEAVAFAVLAHRFVMGLTGNIPGATGAAEETVLGSLTLP